MIQEKLFGNIGLNKDDDPRYFGENDTDHILNMLPDTDENGGLLKTLDGNVEIPTNIDWVLTSSRKVIETCKRADNDLIYYFVKGLSIHGGATTTTTPMGFDPESELDFEYNSIIEFNPLTGTFRVIVFEEEHLYMGDWVVGAMVFGDYIIYNSGAHGMRKVHIEYAYRYYNGVAGATYPTITSTTFALRNLPPVDVVTGAYSTDTSRSFNNLFGRTFQFAYRYKYVDGGYSVYSEYSSIFLPLNVEMYDGSLTEVYPINNRLTLSFTRGDTDIVEAVDLVVREGNDGEWRLITTITEDVSTVDFYNDETYEAVEQDELLKGEDSIPLRVADATVVNENRLVLARQTEGFDSVELDVTLTPRAVPVTIVAPGTASIDAFEVVPLPLVTPPYQGAGIDTDAIDPSTYDVGDILLVTIIINGNPFSLERTLVAEDLADKEALLRLIQGMLSTYDVAYVHVLGLDGATNNLTWNSGTDFDDNDDIEIGASTPGDEITGSIVFYNSEILAATNKWNTYKSGATHPHGVQYWDEEFRRSTVQLNSNCDVVIPERGAYSNDLAYRVVLDWTISHMAPSWAKYWSWVYAGNKTQSSFVQYISTGTPSVVGPYLEVDIAPLQNLRTDLAINVSLPGSVIDPYEFVAGDRVRILTAAAAAGAYGDSYSVAGGDYYDLPILGLNGTALQLPAPLAGTYGIGDNSLLEIYIPRTFIEGAETYHRVGPINLVVDGYHMSSDGVSQAAGVPASGTIEGGDAYLIGRAFSETVTGGADGDLHPVESMHWSDFYQSDAYDRGRPNIYSSIGEVTHNSIRWGWKYFSGSSINNLFTFDPLDYKPTTEIYGDIVRIGEMGDVLKVIFERKVASMYIGKREVYDASGSVFTVQDGVLSNPNYSIEDYGTTDPRAVLFVRGYCYFVDLNAGAVIRNTNNGSYPISGKADAGGEGADYKMHSFFRDTCANALKWNYLSPYSVMLGWDDGRKVLYVSILQSGLSEYTVAFRESRGRWVSFLEFRSDPDADEVFYPTCYQWAGNKFYSWLDGSDSVWTHTSVSATPLSIYGHIKTAEINVWGNAQPNMIKVFDSIAIHTNTRGWSGIVAIPENLSYPSGMSSVLPETGFEAREDVLYAPYLGNLQTTGVYSVASLYNGESLRGYVIGNQLSIINEAWLFKVDINYRGSNV